MVDDKLALVCGGQFQQSAVALPCLRRAARLVLREGLYVCILGFFTCHAEGHGCQGSDYEGEFSGCHCCLVV